MPVAAAAVGVEVRGRPWVVTTRDCLAYAAGIGDTSSLVFDDESPRFMACPQMCVTLEWPVFIDPALTGAWGMSATEGQGTLHLVQDSVFHRPIRVGDALTTTAHIIGVDAAPSGTRASVLLTTRDDAGETVVESWSTCLMRGVPLDGTPHQLSTSPSWPSMPPKPGLTEHSIALNIAREAPHVYSECARIWAPIHTEQAVAHAAGLPEVILHGTATWALAGREIVRVVAGGDHRRLARLSGRFASTVVPGTTITVEITTHQVDGGVLVIFEVHNPDGSRAIKDGRALVRPAQTPAEQRDQV